MLNAFVSPTVLTAVPLVLGIIVLEVRRRRREQKERSEAAGLPAAVDRLIQDLRAGYSLRQSCERIDEPLLAPLSAGLRAGKTLRDATAHLERSRDPSVQLLAVTLHVLAGAGGSAVPALQRLRHTLIGAVHVREQAATEASQSLASASLLVAAPAVFGGAIALLDKRAATFYLYEPIGTICVVLSVGLSALGWSWIQRSVRLTVERSR